MSESDGIDEAIEGITRVGLTVAGRLGEQLSRAREQTLRRTQAAEEQQARELQARFDAERAAARAQLAPVKDERWWDTANSRDIERVHATATAWKAHDPAAHDAATTIQEQLKRRYGVNADDLRADEASVTAVWDRVQRNREQAGKERNKSEAEDIEASLLLAEVARSDRAREKALEKPSPEELAKAKEWLAEKSPAAAHNWTMRHDFADTLADERSMERDLVRDWAAARESDTASSGADIKYDSAERRKDLAASLEGVADREAVQARLIADQDQGTPPSAAIASAPNRNPKARKSTPATGIRKLLQKGMSR